MSDKKLLFKSMFFGSVCGLLLSVILMCICAVIILSIGLLPADLTKYVMLAVLGSGAMFGGFIAARITKSAGLLVGMLTGFVIFILITILGLIKNTDAVSIATLLRFIITIVTGAIGGILGVNKKEKLHIK